MNDTFRMDPRGARRQLLLTSTLVLGVMSAWVIRDIAKSGGVDPSAVVALGMAALIAGFICWQNYRRALEFAAHHSLVLGPDAVLVRDGATERRIPYGAIELLKVRRPLIGSANFTLKVDGVPADVFYGYEDIEGLISALVGRLPREKVQGRNVHV